MQGVVQSATKAIQKCEMDSPNSREKEVRRQVAGRGECNGDCYFNESGY